jgi:NTE family protein
MPLGRRFVRTTAASRPCGSVTRCARQLVNRLVPRIGGVTTDGNRMSARSSAAISSAASFADGRFGRLLAWRWPLPAFNLALQGGGAHGAFTWGVLDRLLEEKRFRFQGVSGASAGAINAAVLASGWLAGGPAGAREALARLWREVAAASRMSPLRAAGLTQMATDFAAQLLSPYQLNPFDLNPLRSILERLVDFDRLRRDRSLSLFISATNLRTGQGRIFRNPEITSDVLLASACLPQLHQAVRIEGEAYWDGGLTSNPPLLPMIERCGPRDVLLIQINPLRAVALPTSARQIRNRLAEIVFGRPLASELDTLARSARLARSPLTWLRRADRRLARHRLHRIDGSAELALLDPNTRIDPDWPLLVRLHDRGGRRPGPGFATSSAGRSRPPRNPAITPFRPPRPRRSQHPGCRAPDPSPSG